MVTPKSPRETPNPRERPVISSRFDYRTRWGCVFWLLSILALWILIGLWGGIAWWPWWW